MCIACHCLTVRGDMQFSVYLFVVFKKLCIRAACQSSVQINLHFLFLRILLGSDDVHVHGIVTALSFWI